MQNNNYLHINTPLIKSTALSRPNLEVWLKMESMQPAVSFKNRGVGFACKKYVTDGAEHLISSSGGNAGGEDRRSSSGGSSDKEPLVSDLRLHIAKDLQMEDSAELLELLVANKILDMNLKLRVVQQVLWKKYVEENATSASSKSSASVSTSLTVPVAFTNSFLESDLTTHLRVLLL